MTVQASDKFTYSVLVQQKDHFWTTHRHSSPSPYLSSCGIPDCWCTWFINRLTFCGRKKYFQKGKQVWRGKKAHNLLVGRWRVLVIQARQGSPLRLLSRCLWVGRKDSWASFGEKHKRKCSVLGWRWSRKGEVTCSVFEDVDFPQYWLAYLHFKECAMQSFKTSLKAEIDTAAIFLNWSRAPINLTSSAISFQLFWVSLDTKNVTDCDVSYLTLI